MNIESVEHVRTVSAMIHDSEFGEGDFGYDPVKKRFYLNTRSPGEPSDRFHLEFEDVERYDPAGIERIRAGRGLAGVFNCIRIRGNGRRLTLVSQDLQIHLELNSLRGHLTVDRDA